MPDNNAPVQQTPAQPSPQPLEVSDQSFRRMPSQRRRRLWMLAAQHRGSSLLAPAKPGTVRTQDSGISSMDYVTSREANSPNSEDAGLVSSATAGSSRPRANTTAGLLLCDPREPRVCSEVDTRPRLSIGPPFLSPHASTAAGTTGVPNFRTEITIPKGDGEYRQPDYSSHLSTQRYTALCHNYVPDWVRRNWSSAPRPLIPRQRSSVETTGMETSNDWTSMEALNIQHSLYPYNWRLYSGRYGGRFSCPKASVFFESFLNDPSLCLTLSVVSTCPAISIRTTTITAPLAVWTTIATLTTSRTVRVWAVHFLSTTYPRDTSDVECSKEWPQNPSHPPGPQYPRGRPDVRVHRSLRAGTGLIRGRSVDEAFSSQSRGTEPFAGRGEGGALSYQQPYRMTASDFQIAHRPYRAPAAGWEEKQASLLAEDDPICCHGLVPSQAGGHFYRPRLCPHIYEEDESAWKPYEVSVEAAPGRLGSFYPTQRIRK
ncbi:hypothetical protein AAHC03_026252 [Spirometra sp. Aus1]